MIEGLPWQVWSGVLSASLALNALAVTMVLRGKLLPRSTYDDKVHEANEWRAESRLKDAQIAEKDEQLRHLGAVGRTVDAVMRAIQRGAKDHEVSE